MRSSFVIIGDVRSKDSFQMSLIENDDVVKAFSAYRADQAFYVRRLPGRTICDDYFLHTHVLNSLAEEVPVDGVAITNQKTRGCIIGKYLDNLLGRSDGSRVRCYVEVNDFPALVTQHDKSEEYAERSGRDSEEVNRNDVSNMIVEIRTPSL